MNYSHTITRFLRHACASTLLLAAVAMPVSGCATQSTDLEEPIGNSSAQLATSSPTTKDINAFKASFKKAVEQDMDCWTFCDLVCATGAPGDVCFCGGQSYDCGSAKDECPEEL